MPRARSVRIQKSPRLRHVKGEPPGTKLGEPPTVRSIYPDLRKAVLLAAGLFILFRLAGLLTTLLLFFLLAFILAAVLNPVANYLERWRVPRALSAAASVLLLLGAVGGLLWLALPPLIGQASDFINQVDLERFQVSGWYESLLAQYPRLRQMLPAPEELSQSLMPNLRSAVGHVGTVAMTLGSGMLSFFVLVVMVIYSVSRPAPLLGGLLAAVPERYRIRTDRAVRRGMEQVKNWVVGAAISGLIVGLITGVGLYLLGVPYALLFGILAAFGELIPYIGPFLAAVPPLLVALIQDPTLAVWVALLFLVIQQLEGNVVTPLVMGRVMELHPVSLIAIILVMHALFGIMGAILAVPTAALIKVVWEEFYLKPTRTDPELMKEEGRRIRDERPPILNRPRRRADVG
ncbi:MAG: AI-2E family transporter [Armatimonadota bacterium]